MTAQSSQSVASKFASFNPSQLSDERDTEEPLTERARPDGAWSFADCAERLRGAV